VPLGVMAFSEGAKRRPAELSLPRLVNSCHSQGKIMRSVLLWLIGIPIPIIIVIWLLTGHA
jgi:hypothetical protein